MSVGYVCLPYCYLFATQPLCLSATISVCHNVPLSVCHSVSLPPTMSEYSKATDLNHHRNFSSSCFLILVCPRTSHPTHRTEQCMITTHPIQNLPLWRCTYFYVSDRRIRRLFRKTFQGEVAIGFSVDGMGERAQLPLGTPWEKGDFKIQWTYTEIMPHHVLVVGCQSTTSYPHRHPPPRYSEHTLKSCQGRRNCILTMEWNGIKTKRMEPGQNETESSNRM